MVSMAAAGRYPDELKERAVAMVRELQRELGLRGGAIARVSEQLGVNKQTLRYWLAQDQSDLQPAREAAAGPAVDPVVRIAELERENRELRRANEILKAASAYFARELDPKLPR
jgi:transposase